MKKALPWLNVSAYLATLIVNGLANALPLNGLSTGEISDRFQVFFVPAGYVFSIWGLIYLLLGAFVVYQALPAQKDNPLLGKIGALFILASLANIVWLFLWHYERFIATIFAMAALLLTLLAIYTRLGIGHKPVGRNDSILVHLPFSVYLGWISVATIANATSLLDYLGWQGWGLAPESWAIVMLAVSTLLGLRMASARKDIAYTGVLIWALIGIAVKQQATQVVAAAAGIGAAVLAVYILLGFARRGRVRTSQVEL
jgi:hypothetical protein